MAKKLSVSAGAGHNGKSRKVWGRTEFLMIPKISIIIPVYNVESYIKRSLDSVIGQTLREIEIILIDDGSSDGSGPVCEGYAAKDSRVKVIHQKNAGASAARNSGMAIATGEYLGFVDADDCAAPNMFELLYRHAEKAGADIAMCEYAEIGGDPDLKLPELSIDDHACRVLDPEDAFQVIGRFEKKVNVTVWNKIFRRETVRDLKFDPEIRVSHDMDYLMKALTKSQKIVYLPYTLYGYFIQRPGALTSSDHDEDLLWNIETYHHDDTQIMDEFAKNNPNMRDLAMGIKCTGDLTLVKTMIRAGRMNRETTGMVRKDIWENLLPVMRSKLIPFLKIQMLIFVASPKMFQVFYKKYKLKE